MGDDENGKRFESLAMPDSDAACNLARWLTRNDDAVDHHLEAVFAGARRRLRTQGVTVGLTTGPIKHAGKLS